MSYTNNWQVGQDSTIDYKGSSIRQVLLEGLTDSNARVTRLSFYGGIDGLCEDTPSGNISAYLDRSYSSE